MGLAPRHIVTWSLHKLSCELYFNFQKESGEYATEEPDATTTEVTEPEKYGSSSEA